MMCNYSLRRTRAGVKEFYAIGVVFSLMHFAFEPWRTKINKKMIDGPSVKAKDGARELLDAQNTIRQLVDLPAWLAFTCGFARLCRLTSEVKVWSFFLPSTS